MNLGDLHIITYDMRGTIVHTGQPKPCRQTGLVVHTHQLLAGLALRTPQARVAVTQTGGRRSNAYRLETPEGLTVLAQGVDTSFRDCLAPAAGVGKDPALVRRFYEEEIDNRANPVYASLARQYGEVIAAAGSANLLLQNINPIVGVLKAEQHGHLDALRLGPLNLTCVVHDLADAPHRFEYLRRRMALSGHRIHLVAVSGAVRHRLLEAGLPADRITTVPNGLDVAGFRDRLATARSTRVFDAVRARNHLPPGRIVLVSARRVLWKGHLDVLDAVAALRADGALQDAVVVFNGHNLTDTREAGYQELLARRISELGLRGRVFLLDDLDPLEVASCYEAAHIAVLPSREPEAFGYANIEAMLAGVPVITTAHGAPLDYIEDGRSGVLVPPSDPAAIAAALRVLLTDAPTHACIGAAGRVSAQQFTVESMIDGYLSVIASLQAGEA
ncbi:hypothetical protein GCM10022247_35910 [Allokutzneria multivorans]|uniref:Glycosyl transferase family 1 domain-containing protein n=1 Tax=Allokutzneria multivorans TaxID=1142134 RepID=A0ABP7SE92_9PSEU